VVNISKFLFPRCGPGRRRHELRTLGYVLIFAVVFSLLVGVVIYALYQQNRI